jgi:glycosyltransferase involved in cell wall biosynthesis
MDKIVCVSGHARENFIRRYPELESRTQLIYNFYDTDTIRTQGHPPCLLPGLNPALLSVGRMTEQKKYLRFLDVLARLRDEGFSFGWHILGQGAQWTAIEEKVLALNLQDRVFLHGVTDNPYQYMTACDLFVLPSGWEGFPTVTVEAKILGCPVLATDVAGIQEQLIHGKTGWIVENSEDGIYEGLKYLLQNPDVTGNLRSSEGMSRICDNQVKYQAFIKIIT